jgi:hypothetical protein
MNVPGSARMSSAASAQAAAATAAEGNANYESMDEEEVLAACASSSSTVINTLASATGEECIAVLRLGMQMLAPWAADPELAAATAVPAARVVASLLRPGSSTSFTDAPLCTPACVTFLAPFAASSANRPLLLFLLLLVLVALMHRRAWKL